MLMYSFLVEINIIFGINWYRKADSMILRFSFKSIKYLFKNNPCNEVKIILF